MAETIEQRLKRSNDFAKFHGIGVNSSRPYLGSTRTEPCTLETLKDIEIIQSFAFWVTDGFYFANQFSPCWMLVSADCYNPLDLSPIFKEGIFTPPEKVIGLHVPGIDGALHPQSYALLSQLVSDRSGGLEKSRFGRATQGLNYVTDPDKSDADLSLLYGAISRLQNSLTHGALGGVLGGSNNQCKPNPCEYVALSDRPFLITPC